MNRSKRMLRGSMSLVAMLAIVIAVSTSLPSQYQCNPSASKPNGNYIEVENVADKKGRVVTNLAGHLELLGNTTTNLPLDIKTIYNAMLDVDHSQHRVAMIDEHVYLSIFYHTKDWGNSYEFTEIEMSVNNGTESGYEYKLICSFDEKFVFSLPVHSRYSCRNVLSHPCSRDGNRVANLVLESFELELDGDQEKIAKGEFSKPAWEASCDHWKEKERGSAYLGWGIIIFIIIIITTVITIIIKRGGGGVYYMQECGRVLGRGAK